MFCIETVESKINRTTYKLGFLVIKFDLQGPSLVILKLHMAKQMNKWMMREEL